MGSICSYRMQYVPFCIDFRASFASKLQSSKDKELQRCDRFLKRIIMETKVICNNIKRKRLPSKNDESGQNFENLRKSILPGNWNSSIISKVNCHQLGKLNDSLVQKGMK
ncbi:hypothetical protein CEXT_196771 [Caerostris extrusa]|uniref:Uncharacterized protein n=1 Tax=Caerostris extrusa TaxID=172846 RepID=A0AAV4MSK0_CAEEX|nr:hypothetical protein CEXT_196771 [Caerostris extrusa]